MNSNFNSGKKKVDSTKYKTEMCKNWLAVGYCSYGNKCRFAHGRNELANKQKVSFQSFKFSKLSQNKIPNFLSGSEQLQNQELQNFPF